MTLKDWAQSAREKLKTCNIFGLRDDGVESNMANGGFSGYHPNTARHRAARDTQRQQPAGEVPQQDMNGGWNPYGDANPYTGAVPPQDGGYQQTAWQGDQQYAAWQGDQQTAWQDPQQTGWQNPQQTGWQNPQQTGWQNPQQTGWQNPQQTAWQNPQQAGWQAEAQPFGMGGYNQGAANYQQPTGPQQPLDNISYMPGNFVDEDGTAYSHLERIAVVSNVASCYRMIEFMRNGESVIINIEQITDEAECQRCLDLLYGASFAMKCVLTRVASRSIYLLSPASVLVKPYDTIRRMSEQDVHTRWPGSETPRWERTQPDPRTQGRPGTWSTPRQNDYMSFGGYGNAAGYGR